LYKHQISLVAVSIDKAGKYKSSPAKVLFDISFSIPYLQHVLQADLQWIDEIVCRNCDRCGATTRLFGIESHPTMSSAELHTYVCERCEALQTQTVPLRS
jgi:hypothetical protein